MSTTSHRPRPSEAQVTKHPTKIHSLAHIAERAQLTGSHPIEVGEGTVLHPYSKILSSQGKVTIGKNCTVSEEAIIGSGEGEGDVVIGNEVNIETGAVIEAGVRIGEGTVVEVQARVGKGAVLGKHCKITSQSTVRAGEELPDFTVVFGSGERRLDHTLATSTEVQEAKHKGQMKHVELLKKLIVDGSAKWR